MSLDKIHSKLIECFRSGGKLLIAGNGGSAADAQHIAAEFMGRYSLIRKPLPAIALASDVATITCIGNDFGFDYIFSRPLQALAKKNDVFLALSTSGHSTNIQMAVWQACNMGVYTILFTGRSAPKQIKDVCDTVIEFEGETAGEIQENYMKYAHQWCKMVDDSHGGEAGLL